MLAALLLNLGGQPPPQPPAKPRFGGGPFWSRYGYDSAYEAIRRNRRTTSSTVYEPEDEPEPLDKPVVRPRAEPPQLNYRLLESRVADAVAADMRKFRDIREQDRLDDEEAEAILMLFLLGD